MTIQVNLGNRKRKELAGAVGGIFGATPSYKGPPSYAYEAGRAIIDREGNITLKKKSRFDSQAIQRLMDGLRENGFDPRLIDETGEADNAPAAKAPPEAETPADKTAAASSGTLAIRLPHEGFGQAAHDNLVSLIVSKLSLIRKSMEITDTPVFLTDTAVEFPWFERELPEPERVAYTNFLGALCDMARRQKRVIATERQTDNDKFVFRLFLVRLGLIGDEYADTRRILLRNLKGNGSVKDPNGTKALASDNEPSTATDSAEDKVRLMGTDVLADQKCVSLIKKFGYFLLHIDD